MFGKVTALEGLHVPGKYRDKSMTHTCSRHATCLTVGASTTPCIEASPSGPSDFDFAQHRCTPRPCVERIRRKVLLKDLENLIQEYLARNKTPPPPWTPLGP